MWLVFQVDSSAVFIICSKMNPRNHFQEQYLFPSLLSTTEFKEERRILLEVIGPELQSLYDDRQIEVSEQEGEGRNIDETFHSSHLPTPSAHIPTSTD